MVLRDSLPTNSSRMHVDYGSYIVWIEGNMMRGSGHTYIYSAGKSIITIDCGVAGRYTCCALSDVGRTTVDPTNTD